MMSQPQHDSSGAQRRLRVCLVSTELRVGGAERCLTRLALQMDRRQFEPRVVSLAPRPPAAADQLVRQLERGGVEVSFLNVTRPRQVLQATARLKKLLRQRMPDVLQSFLFHANMVSLAAAPRELPVSIGVRVADPRRWRQLAERWAVRRAARIVCVSQSVSDFCQHQAGFPPQKLVVIPNGVELPASPPPPAELPGLQGRRLLLCVGRLHPQKGLDWLLSWLPQLLQRLPDHDLLVAGEGPQRQQLQTMASQGPLAGRVHLLGQRDDVPRLLAACDLLLLPSRWEGMPNVLLEAMAAGRAVVASRVEGVSELLGPDLADRQTAPFGDVEAWLQRVVQCSGESLAADLGRENRARAAQFSIDHMVQAYQRLFHQLTCDKSASTSRQNRREN